MKTLYEYLTESKIDLEKEIDKRLKKDGDQFLCTWDSDDPEESLLPEITQEYGLSELWLKMDNRQQGALRTDHDVVELVSIQVLKDKRGQGIAKKVLEILADWADKRNIVLTGDPDDMFNTPLASLYKLYGSIGMEPTEKFDTDPKKFHLHKIARYPNGENKEHYK